jgi:hypothetical protein
VECWEEEKGMKTILSPRIIYYRIQREMKKIDTQFRTPTRQREMRPSNPTMSTKTSSKKKSCK